MQKQGKEQTKLSESVNNGLADEGSELKKIPEEKDRLRLKLYKLLLEKYSEIINESERRTIGEIKGLVSSDDLTVQSVTADFKKQDYSFEKDFLETAQKIFEFLSKEISFAESEVNLNYWLSPKEIFSEKIADDEDFAIFFCSILLALGDENASIVIAELENSQTHAFVITEFRGTFFIFDPSQKHGFFEFSGKRDDVLMKYSFNAAKIKQFLYKFNSSSYEQFVE